ncbi:hypothetical protein GE09DRAFT_1213308 [Coniochaeta sp. 2T2.1]|nr:hypothetical protein GE09DRAFT_1213308 [Coniochaeta sp. 2T2.1]
MTDRHRHRDSTQGSKSRASRSPTVTTWPSWLRLNHLLPTFHREGSHPQRHTTPPYRSPHRDRISTQNQHRVKNRDGQRDGHRDQETQPRPVTLILRDLDHRRGRLSITAKRGTVIAELERRVRLHIGASDHPHLSAVQVRFFADARQLNRHDTVDGHRSVWFRVYTLPDDNDWKLTRLRDGVHEVLDSRLAARVTRRIDDGDTVGQLRKLVARHMDIEDPNRIAFATCNGVRLGSLQGDMWGLRLVRRWFCRWLSIEVRPSGSYVVVRGPWGEYLFHPSLDCRAKGLNTRDVKDWLRQRCLNTVDCRNHSDLSLHRSQISLTCRGNRLSDYDPIYYGATVGFEIPSDLEAILAAEESWLLPGSETCTVCFDSKNPTEMALQITAGCKHKGTTCRDCLKQWIHSSLESSTWDKLKCPECPTSLTFGTVKRYASKDDFERYDTLATRAALESMPNFRWCLSPDCESGQIHDPTCLKFTCMACKGKHCVNHNKPWHSGETCKEYDRRKRRGRKDDKASEKMIKQTSRPCPECKKFVHRFAGCNHITCVCGHEWCYVCSSPFLHNRQGLLYCRHKHGCTERDPVVGMMDADGNIVDQPRFVQLNNTQPDALPPLAPPRRVHERPFEQISAPRRRWVAGENNDPGGRRPPWPPRLDNEDPPVDNWVRELLGPFQPNNDVGAHIHFFNDVIHHMRLHNPAAYEQLRGDATRSEGAP